MLQTALRCSIPRLIGASILVDTVSTSNWREVTQPLRWASFPRLWCEPSQSFAEGYQLSISRRQPFKSIGLVAVILPVRPNRLDFDAENPPKIDSVSRELHIADEGYPSHCHLPSLVSLLVRVRTSSA